MVACNGRSLLFGEDPTQVLSACDTRSLRVCVERRHYFVGNIPDEDISHALHDIARHEAHGADATSAAPYRCRLGNTECLSRMIDWCLSITRLDIASTGTTSQAGRTRLTLAIVSSYAAKVGRI